VRLTSSDGASLDLRPTRYQFEEALRPSRNWDEEWDPNWLIIHGEVRTALGAAWSFDDPCLTTWEAAELLDWLRSAAEGRITATETPDEDSPGMLTFVEPNLGFSVAGQDDSHVAVRAHLSAEAVTNRPSAIPHPWDTYAYSVVLRLTRAELLAAAQDWQDDLTPFPRR
jgi:hypothetical protein